MDAPFLGCADENKWTPRLKYLLDSPECPAFLQSFIRTHDGNH
jgi:hypothetical protein